MGRKAFLMASALLALVSCGRGKVSVSETEMEDKVFGSWAGKVIGVQFGQPHEFWHLSRINEGELVWTPELIDGAVGQDDIYTQLSFLGTFDKYGLDATADQLAAEFAEAGFELFHANLQARKNWFDGLRPPATGSATYNAHADDIDFQIDADFIGLMCPGMPGLVREYCDRIGPIMCDGDGIDGGVFIASMHSLAFFENDILKIVEGALKNIPSESEYARCISDVVECYKADPSDWKAAWNIVHERWERHICTPGHPFDIDAKVNGAYVVIGLLYGGGDFRKTMELAVRCGQDADCNASNAAAVWGVVHGYEAIPSEYRECLSRIEGKKFSYTDYDFRESARKILEFMKLNIVKGGGKVKGGRLTVRLDTPCAKERCRVSFPGMKYSRTILSDDPSWSYSGSWHRFTEFDKAPFIETVEVGAAAEVGFDGEMVTLIGAWDQDCGKADIFIDGKFVRRIDSWWKYRCGFFSINRQVLFVASGLERGHHTFRIETVEERSPESTGNRLMFLGLDVYSSDPT